MLTRQVLCLTLCMGREIVTLFSQIATLHTCDLLPLPSLLVFGYFWESQKDACVAATKLPRAGECQSSISLYLSWSPSWESQSRYHQCFQSPVSWNCIAKWFLFPVTFNRWLPPHMSCVPLLNHHTIPEGRDGSFSVSGELYGGNYIFHIHFIYMKMRHSLGIGLRSNSK